MWILSKLRTGYFLNEYLCKIGVVGKPYCKCEEIESCEHYLMECEEVQDLRERLKVKMWQLTGKDLWTMEAFLAVTNKDEYEQERFIINDFIGGVSGKIRKTHQNSLNKIYQISRTTKYSRESTRDIIPRRNYLCDIAA